MSLDNQPPSLDSLFEAALEIESSADREAFLTEVCRGHPALRNQIEDLLRADREAGSFLDTPSISDGGLFSPDKHIDSIPGGVLRNSAERLTLQPISIGDSSDQTNHRYQLLGEIARGGMGAIIHGHDVDLRRDLALKVLLEQHKDNPDYIRRFVEEAQISGQLQHPGIAPVFELGRLDDRRPYFSMKLVEGETLAAILEAREIPSDDRVRLLSVFEQICQTMAYAHSRGVIHRDLKPTNIMVGNFGEVQVMDWGLAKVFRDNPADGQMTCVNADSQQLKASFVDASAATSTSDSATRLGSVMGTFPYMSPEQAGGKVDRLDERADVFALGSILCEMLTGSPAYVPRDDSDIHQMAAEGQLDDCFHRLDECQAELELVQLAKSCLAPDLNARIRNASVVSGKLASFQENLETRLKRAEIEKVAAEVAAKEERRRRRIYVAICLMLAFVGAAAVSVAGYVRSLYMDNLELVAAKELQIKNAVQQRERADRTADLATVRRLAAESRAVQAEQPEMSVLLAIESMRLNRIVSKNTLPIVHESLLNSTQSLGGRPLLGGSQVAEMLMSERRLVTLADGRVHVFDLPTSYVLDEPARVLENESGHVRHIATSDDGQWLLTLGDHVQRWDLENVDAKPQVIPQDEVASVAISPDGRWVVTVHRRGTIQLFDMDGDPKTPARVLADSKTEWDRVLVSREGRWVVLQRADSALRLLKVEQGAVEQIDIQNRLGRVLTTQLSSQGRWLAVGDQSGVRLFDLEASDVSQSVVELPTTAFPNAIKGLRFSQNSRWLFGWHPSFSWITRWDLEAPNRMPLIVDGNDGGVRSLTFAGDGSFLAFGSGSGTLETLEFAADQTLQERGAYQAHDWPVERLAMHPQKHWLATADWNGSLRLWCLNPATRFSSPFVSSGQDDQPYAPTAISSKGRWVATGLNEFGVELWDTHNQFGVPRVLTGHSEKLRKFAFGGHDRWLVTHSVIPDSSQARIWDLTSPSPADDVRVLRAVSAIAMVKDSSNLAAVFQDNTVRLLDLAKDDPAASAQIIGNHEIDSQAGLPEIAISPDARWLVTKCQTTDPTIKVQINVWDLKAASIAQSCRKLDGRSQFSWGTGLSIDATSRWLVTFGGEGSEVEDTVTVWDLLADDIQASARTVKEKGGVYQAAISPNCEWIFTAGGKDVQLWDLRNDELVSHPLSHCGQAAAISRDGRWLAASGRVQFNTLLFDLEADEPWNSARVLRGHKAPIWSLAFSDDSRWLVTDSSDGTVRRWCMDRDWLLQHAQKMVGREVTQDERALHGLERTSAK